MVTQIISRCSIAILRWVFSLFLVSQPIPQSCSHHEQLWALEWEHWDLCTLWNLLIEGESVQRGVILSVARKGPQGLAHTSSGASSGLHSCVKATHINHTSATKNLITYKEMQYQKTHLEMATLHPVVFLWLSVVQKQPLRWLRNDVCRNDSVQRKISFSYCFNNTKATNQLKRQAADILLLLSSKKK